MKKEKEFIKAYRYLGSFFSNRTLNTHFLDYAWGNYPSGENIEEWTQNFDKVMGHRNKYLDDLFNGMGEIRESDRFNDSYFKPIYIKKCQVASYCKVSSVVFWCHLDKKTYERPYDKPFVIFNTIRGNLSEGERFGFDYITEEKNFLV